MHCQVIYFLLRDEFRVLLPAAVVFELIAPFLDARFISLYAISKAVVVFLLKPYVVLMDSSLAVLLSYVVVSI